MQNQIKFTYEYILDDIDNQSDLKVLLESFFYTFMEGDHCILNIFSKNPNENWDNLKSLVAFAKNSHRFDSLPPVTVAETPDSNNIVLNEKDVTPESLYSLFRKNNPDRNDYEIKDVVEINSLHSVRVDNVLDKTNSIRPN